MPKITEARFVIAVPDLQSSAAFYRDVLGFTIHSISDPGFLFYTSGDCTIVAGECPDAIHPSKLGDHSYFAYLHIDGSGKRNWQPVESLYIRSASNAWRSGAVGSAPG